MKCVYHMLLIIDVTPYNDIWYDMICLLTAIGLTPGGSSTVHSYTQSIQEQHNETEYPEHNIHNKNT